MNKKDAFFLLMWVLFPIYMFLLGASAKAMMSYNYGASATTFSIIPILATIVAILFGIVALIFWVWMLIDLIKRQGMETWKKVLYIIAFFVLSILATSGYYLNNTRKDWDPEKKNSKKLFWATILLFIFGVFCPIIGLLVA